MAVPERVVFHVTGFGSFPGVAENPTQWLARHLEAAWAKLLEEDPTCRNFTIGTCREMEVSAVGVMQGLMEIYCNVIRTRKADEHHVFLHLGVDAQQENYLKLEQVGHNEVTFLCGDTRKWDPIQQEAYIGGPATLESDLPFERIQQTASECVGALQGPAFKDMTVILSRDAGRYICNFTLYMALKTIRTEEHEHALFLHVPQVETICLEQQLEALVVTMREMARALVTPAATAV
mmetsp:Transcript_2930/g.10282  ORF Transcript_2930/g.10282 Transcript_2930/m.10282 type:complete len:235 (-) Transcript_2930:40-744(-)